ncbi:MAG TPA: hypothetical protein VN937_07900 [Blastocatellia bacterium]|nr:hypothetical protein [Blastocatellia bacterium]
MAIDTKETPALRTRYPGSKPFTRDDEALFFGRDEDISKLGTFITVEKTTVLYGKSGLGKTSLLNAGVVPKLEADYQYHVIPIRFGSYTQGNLRHPLDIAEEGIAAFPHQESFLTKLDLEDVSLWLHIKSLELALPEHTTFLLVFDQFEELFTYPEGVNEFAQTLADLLYGRTPEDSQRALRLATRNDSSLITPGQWEFLRRPVNLKVLMSIRSDRMSLLDTLASQIPSILLNCYELKPLSRAQAEDAITSPAQRAGQFLTRPFTYQQEALDKILNYLTQNKTKPIESFQLQILCAYVEELLAITKSKYVEESDIGNLEGIYQNYYDSSIKKLGTEEEQMKARVFIEEGLVFANENRRISLYEGQIHDMFDISAEFLRKLTDTHIIRSEPHSAGGYLYEVSHDTLVAPILKAKALRYRRIHEEKLQRELSEQKKKRRRMLIRFALLIAFPGICATLFSLWMKYDNQMAEIAFLEVVAGFFFYGIILLCLIAFMLSVVTFVIEFVSGESILSRLRKRADNPAKQKGFLTKVGRWLS